MEQTKCRATQWCSMGSLWEVSWAWTATYHILMVWVQANSPTSDCHFPWPSLPGHGSQARTGIWHQGATMLSWGAGPLFPRPLFARINLHEGKDSCKEEVSCLLTWYWKNEKEINYCPWSTQGEKGRGQKLRKLFSKGIFFFKRGVQAVEFRAWSTKCQLQVKEKNSLPFLQGCTGSLTE